jgi:dGTPase
MYTKQDEKRYFKEVEYDPSTNDPLEYRTEFRRDLARVVHSHCFRRLVGKTQLFPKNESDFFRNRLTHSLEVAQIAKSIALKLNKNLEAKNQIDLDLVELAGMAHDIGHPPFGHQGEEVLAECMLEHGGFEGNAQTLRALSKIEKKIIHKNGFLSKAGFDDNGKDLRGGLNLTYRSLASILKYNSNITEQIKENAGSGKLVFKGYYNTEKDLVEKIIKWVGGGYPLDSFKTVECQIMDIADDITYSTYDLEDAFKAGFISPVDMLIQDNFFYEEISREVNSILQKDEFSNKREVIDPEKIKDIISDLFKFLFELPAEIEGIKKLGRKDLSGEEYSFLTNQYTTRYNELITKNGYTRGHFSSQLIKQTINNIKFEFNPEKPAFSKIWLETSDLIRVEILKRIAFKTQILSPKLQAQELRGQRIVRKIFEYLKPNGENPPKLLPDDFKTIYIQKPNDKNHQYRTICDYIACMTDRYAIEFYGRITSENPSSIFKVF